MELFGVFFIDFILLYVYIFGNWFCFVFLYFILVVDFEFFFILEFGG